MKNKNFLLFCPGPVLINEKIKKSILNYNIGHREKEFSEILEKLNEYLLDFLNIKNKDKYHSVFITGSSTAANETVIFSLFHLFKKNLVLANGEFGLRLYKIAKNYNPIDTYILDFGWANIIDIKKVEEFIKKNNIEMILMVHHETSTGMINPVIEIGKLAKKYKIVFFVDAVSSIGAENIKMEEWGIDFLTGTSGKALGGFPGFSFVVGKKEIYERLKEKEIKGFYLNLWNYYYYSNNFSQTPNTPSIFSFIVLYEILKKIKSQGKEKYFSLIKKRAEKIRSFLKSKGIEFLIDEKYMSSSLTTVYPPKGFTVNSIMNYLRKKKIIVYNGKGPFKDKVFQIANIGDLKDKDIDYFIKVFEKMIYGKKI